MATNTYRVLQRSFINHRLVEEGELIEFDGEAGSNLELVEPESRAESGKGRRGAKAQADDNEETELV